MNIYKPGVYVSDGSVRCTECQDFVPAGSFIAVDDIGVIVCTLHRREYYNAVMAAAAYDYIMHGERDGRRAYVKPGLIERVRSNLWIWEGKER
jgi:hypothetical protein